MHAIHWPDDFRPGETDFFVANENVVTGLSAKQVWGQMQDTTHWNRCYPDIGDIHFTDGAGPILQAGSVFRFVVGGTPVNAQILECTPPSPGEAGRLSWRGKVDHEGETVVRAHCAWLVEDLPGERVRLVFQETLRGEPARALATTKPNPALNAHQDWVNGILAGALEAHA